MAEDVVSLTTPSKAKEENSITFSVKEQEYLQGPSRGRLYRTANADT